jgi:pyruvate/2-oxoglutarate dehydrogenase complex dihydrolipoamide acyltransferase (E2) component
MTTNKITRRVRACTHRLPRHKGACKHAPYGALGYDHRVVDGKGAVAFLVRMKEALEDPRRLLMDL